MNKLIFFMRVLTMVIMTMLMFGCSETEQFMDKEINPSKTDGLENAAPILTKSECIALTVQKKGTYKISEKEAIRNLERFSKSASNGKKGDYRIKSMTLKKNLKTKKDLYYEVVFDGDKGQGFSILSADERTDELLCYSEVGSVSDTSFNKSLKFCLELVDQYVEEMTAEELDIDDLALSAKEKCSADNKILNADGIMTKAIPPFYPDDPNSPWVVDRVDVNTSVSERVKLVPGGWHQGEPFNECYWARVVLMV